MKHLSLLLMLLITTGCQMTTAPKKQFSSSTNINAQWLYLEEEHETIPKVADTAYTPINLPHTWNNLDTLKSKKYRRGISWYRKHLTFTEGELKHKRHYLRFGAAAYEADVYINGKHLTNHKGGYSAFIVEMTKQLKAGANTVDVKVSNKHNKHIAPLSGDFNHYGGIYRSVELITLPEASFYRGHRGSNGVRVWSEKVNNSSADLKVKAIIENGSVAPGNYTLKVDVFNPEGEKIASKQTFRFIYDLKRVTLSLDLPEVKEPQLWSPESPTLYKVNVSLYNKEKLLDQVVVNHGFRWFEFTADKGFFLNGKSYQLNGVNRHQDFEKLGSAVPNSVHDLDIKLMKELGVNWLRLAHYQQDDYILDLCNREGMLVWEEIPYVNGTTFDPEFEENLRTQMVEMIEQHYNHPSIILWGMGNEVWMKDRGDGKARCWDIINRLNDLIHAEDPVRKSVFVIGDANYASRLKVMDIPDVIGYNLYRGWYGGDVYSLTARTTQLHKMNPDKPFIISEFGCGSDMRIHSEKPKRYDFSEEYQVFFLEEHLKQINAMKWLCGVNWWNYADFGVARRGDSMPHINQKGVVTFTREKKDSFYMMKAYWSKDPVIYIQSPSWKLRKGQPEKIYRVISNLTGVELIHNGKSLGIKEDHKWPVTLIEGENRLFAKATKDGKEYTHEITVTYQPSKALYKVTADKNQKELEALVDGEKMTRWAGQGETTITLDAGRIALVNGVAISFYKPETREYNLEISVSKDGKKWNSLFTGKSKAKAKQPEYFKFEKQQEVQFIRIKGAGNNENDWNSYFEIIPDIVSERQEKSWFERIGTDPNKKK